MRKNQGLFPGCHIIILQISILVVTLLDMWREGVRSKTGWPGVKIFSLGEIEKSAACLSVAALTLVRADPSPRYTLQVAVMLSKLGNSDTGWK